MLHKLKINDFIFLNKLESNPYHIFTNIEGLWLISKFSKDLKTYHIIGKMSLKSKKSKNPKIQIIQIFKKENDVYKLFF